MNSNTQLVESMSKNLNFLTKALLITQTIHLSMPRTLFYEILRYEGIR
ncbi:hypothetical protein VCRA2123O444_160017 [Vibrio crassostreae]|nr:hypothetical protein VCRA2119O431_160017 [Vibrio crassostreae]CAK1777874.1 hypothetical protein VCRA2113O409_160018 [Vibrio crassostreae]CAK1783106.1 hypothetical protein VCRA2114O422_160085 [Vibrio crassostreae]CAK1784984.1 hypothetical protein VCRA2118O429_160017 [Vibrio crassostreae]CAK1787900.1 hypothetical protein VCRA2113O411_160018 [Vibrio crassostreae]